MAATVILRSPATNRQIHPKIANPTGAADHAVRLIHAICGLAGSASLINDIRADLRADKIRAAIRNGDSAVVFDWLLAALSYQGISDQVAYGYMEKHGRTAWSDIARQIGRASCPKLQSYWHFYDCRYEKNSRTCAEPDHMGRCPLPQHNLRNGHLNQMAYSLFLFIRDLADRDLVGWIDRQLATANSPPGPERLARMRGSLIGPLREIYGVSDKVLTMALSCILLGAPTGKALWAEVGASMIAIDTLVHNFLHRPASWPGLRQAMDMGQLATGPVVAPRLSTPSRTALMLGSSTRLFRSPFPGLCSTRFGGTAARTVSMSATAIASTITDGARTRIAEHG